MHISYAYTSVGTGNAYLFMTNHRPKVVISKRLAYFSVGLNVAKASVGRGSTDTASTVTAHTTHLP